jgi:gentisate 1,2-dioxygenase
MSDVSEHQKSDDDAGFRAALKDTSVSPLRDVMAALVTQQPTPNAVPYVWSYGDLNNQS